MVEVASDTRVLVRYSGGTVTLLDAISWVEVDLTDADGTDAAEGSVVGWFVSGKPLLWRGAHGDSVSPTLPHFSCAATGGTIGTLLLSDDLLLPLPHATHTRLSVSFRPNLQAGTVRAFCLASPSPKAFVDMISESDEESFFLISTRNSSPATNP